VTWLTPALEVRVIRLEARASAEICWMKRPDAARGPYFELLRDFRCRGKDAVDRFATCWNCRAPPNLKPNFNLFMS